jgi:glutamate-1-semialdehyde 2,1-aminomutase
MEVKKMANKETHAMSQEIIARYIQKTPESKRHFNAASSRLPGGDTRRASYFTPYPLFLKKGRGCYIYDYDGNEYIDLQNNYTSLIHGHAHPAINKVAQAQIEEGVVLGSNAEVQYRHAQHICNRIASLELVRYCNSGTEATMLALRAARAFTGRHAILKMDGGYHGMHEYAQVNMFPDPKSRSTPSVHADPWISPNILKDVEIIPFNDLAAAETALDRYGDKLAAIIMEPMFSAGGAILPGPGYLQGMRELADRYNVLLIFDEVMVFRLHYGGLQSYFGVQPDITALGKIIGGGFPIGAVGGRKDIMERFSPAHSQPIFHSGTFSGNNMSLSVGLAGLELYDREAVARLNTLGDRLRNGFKDALKDERVKAHVTGFGSIVAVHWLESEPKNARETLGTEEGFNGSEIARLFHLEMLNRNVFIMPRGQYALSTPMQEKQIDIVIEKFKETLALLKPFIVEMQTAATRY